MIDWSHLPFLLEASRVGSLAAAARALHVDPATVGRRITALETSVGAKLLRRKKGGGLEPTEAGARLLAAAQRTDEAIADTLREVRAQGARPSGVVRMTTVEILATCFVAPRLGELRREHPDVVVDMIVTPQILDLTRKVDLALRLVRPTDESLVARRAGALRMGVYASRAFLDRRRGRLEGLPAIAYGEHFIRVEENAWIERAKGAEVVFRTTSVNAAIAAVAGGLGAGMLPVAVAGARSDLVRLDALGQMEREVWLALHPDLSKTPRVRAVAEFLCDVIASADS